MRWDRGEACMQSLGGMLAPVHYFQLADWRSVSPLHVAPWHLEDMTDQPGILRRLRGDWPCIPFGSPPPEPLPAPWSAKLTSTIATEELHPHGYGANHHWDLDTPAEIRLSVTVRYPDDHPIEALHREVEGISRSVGDPLQPDGDPETTRLPPPDRPASGLPPAKMKRVAVLDVGPHGTVWSHPLDEDVLIIGGRAQPPF